jgi:hypothetical protein
MHIDTLSVALYSCSAVIVSMFCKRSLLANLPELVEVKSYWLRMVVLQLLHLCPVRGHY